jgi:hypothetical protein
MICFGTIAQNTCPISVANCVSNQYNSDMLHGAAIFDLTYF